MKNPLIVAIDTKYASEAEDIFGALTPYVGMFKLGLELITSVGVPDLLLRHFRNIPIMLDMKLADIPNTVHGAVESVGHFVLACEERSVKYITVHATSGGSSVAAAARAAEVFGADIAAVTVLTSIDELECLALYGVAPEHVVRSVAWRAFMTGAKAIVCSPKEAATLHDHFNDALVRDDVKLITPGVRPKWAARNDQERVTTPKEALEAGADYLVIGRPITNPPKGVTCVEAAQRVLEEIGWERPAPVVENCTCTWDMHVSATKTQRIPSPTCERHKEDDHAG